MEDYHKIVKSLENKIYQFSSQLDNQKIQTELLEAEHERIKKELADSNRELQSRTNELERLAQVNLKLKQENSTLENSLSGSQRHRKTLFDHLFTNNKSISSYGHSHVRNDLEAKLKQLNN